MCVYITVWIGADWACLCVCVCVCVCVSVLTLFSCIDFHIICNTLITLRMNISTRDDVTWASDGYAARCGCVNAVFMYEFSYHLQHTYYINNEYCPKQMMSLGRLMDLRMGCGTIWRLRSQTKRWTAQSIAMSRSQTVSWTSPQQACITLVSKISIYGKRHWHLSVRLHSFKMVVTNWSLAFSHRCGFDECNYNFFHLFIYC